MSNCKLLQRLGDFNVWGQFVSQTPYRDLAPGPHYPGGYSPLNENSWGRHSRSRGMTTFNVLIVTDDANNAFIFPIHCV